MMDRKPSSLMGWVKRRSGVVGVPSTIRSPIVALFERWVTESGPEWAIARFKAIRVDLLRSKAGLPKASTWISKTASGRWRGPLGQLESYARKSSWHLERAIALVNIYTSLLAPSVTKQQGIKFLSGVAHDGPRVGFELKSIVWNGIQLAGRFLIETSPFRPKPLLTYNCSPERRAPTPYGSGPELESLVDSVAYLSMGGGVDHMLRFWQYYKPVLLGLEPEVDLITAPVHRFGIGSGKPKQGPLFVGTIAAIQEPGFKLRAIANPGRIFQAVLEPLGRQLYAMLKELPWDCTFDQTRADSAILAHLHNGGTVYSVDLTGATDYFPLDLQLSVLSELFGDDPMIDLFKEVSRGTWLCKFPRDVMDMFGLSKHVQWKSGQPLGLYPSFASFALTHGLLLQGLLGRQWDGDFYILGDDVVILTKSLYLRYREALDMMKCPVSETKTIQSKSLAEFRSRVFLDDGSIIPQFKWRDLSDDSFLDVLRAIPSAYPLLTTRQKRVVDVISGLPEMLGGLGWNPKGLSMLDRIEPFVGLLLRESLAASRLTGLNTRASSYLHYSRFARASGSGPAERLIPDLDQRSRRLVAQSLGTWLVPLYEILGKNLDKVLDGEVDLPYLLGRVGRTSTLTRWESLLSDLFQGSEVVGRPSPLTA